MNSTLRIAAALVALSTAALGGCTADSGAGDVTSDVSEEGTEIGASVDELATSGPVYEAGTKLKTIANLNLRASASTDAAVKRVMPSNSEVTVTARSGDNGWIAISFGSYTGFGHTSYLVEESDDSDDSDDQPAAASSDYSATRGNKLAQTALRVDGHPSGGKCALEMSNSVVQSGLVSSSTWRRGNAWDLANSMKNDSAYQRKVGFVSKTNLTTRTAPKGSIIGWRPGQCGYNRTYGHIEIISTDAHKACSDFCGIVKTCTPGAIFQPTSL